MKIRTKFIATTLSLTIVLMVFHPIGPLGAALWPQPEEGADEPTGAQVPLFLVLFLTEAGVTAFGVAYLLFGWSSTRRLVPGRPTLSAAVHLSISYLFIQWWAHANLHMSVPFSFGSLLAIDYAFHLPMIVASLVVVAGVVAATRTPRPDGTGTRVGTRSQAHDGRTPSAGAVPRAARTER